MLLCFETARTPVINVGKTKFDFVCRFEKYDYEGRYPPSIRAQIKLYAKNGVYLLASSQIDENTEMDVLIGLLQTLTWDAANPRCNTTCIFSSLNSAVYIAKSNNSPTLRFPIHARYTGIYFRWSQVNKIVESLRTSIVELTLIKPKYEKAT